MYPFLACIGFGSVLWVCFKTLEQLSRQPFKRQLTRAIQTSSIFTIGTMLPSFCISVFDAIFTGNLWSIRGFGRSCIASVVTVTILLIFWYSSKPDEWLLRIATFERQGIPDASQWAVVAIRQTTHGKCRIDIETHGEVKIIPLSDASVSQKEPCTASMDMNPHRIYLSFCHFYTTYLQISLL
jgi:hypothetical protein